MEELTQLDNKDRLHIEQQVNHCAVMLCMLTVTGILGLPP